MPKERKVLLERDDIVKIAIEVAVKVGLIALVVYLSYMIAKPFMAVTVWGIIIAVGIAPLIDMLAKRFGHRKKIIVAITVAVILGLLLPTYALSGKTIETSTQMIQKMDDGNITIPPPTEKVKEWPLIGEKIYTFWSDGSRNLKKTLAPFSKDIKKGITVLLSSLGSMIGTILLFVISMIIAAAFLMRSESSVKFYRDFSHRLMGDKGDDWVKLSALTIRSVMNGVLGVAIIQAVLALIGMVLMGVPLAIVWALGVMFLSIIQAPPLLIILPVIAYVFSQATGTAEVVFSIYMIIVGVIDGALKPLFLGRGVDIPMLIILIGAIGGMLSMGIIGLFVGAVVFALAYILFKFWMTDEGQANEEKNGTDSGS